MNTYILVSGCWVGYFFLHSWLAADAVKSRFKPRVYRLFYSIQSTVLLLAILFLLSISRSPVLFPKSTITDFAAFALAAYGVIVVRMAFKQYSLRAFLGIRKGVDDEAFKEDGILSKVRHPLYSGTILLCVGFVLYIPNMLNLLSVIWIFAYLPVGIWLEERKLIKKYGQDYEDYCSRVPAILPKLF